VRLLAAHPQVKAILSGHLHLPFEAALAGVDVLGAPSTWVAITHAGDTFEVGGSDATGARWLELADDGTFTTTVLRA
jgi:Icc protein